MTTEVLRIIRLSTLGSVAVLPILILPSLVGALVVYTNFSESEAGWLMAAGFVGSALGAMLVVSAAALSRSFLPFDVHPGTNRKRSSLRPGAACGQIMRAVFVVSS